MDFTPTSPIPIPACIKCDGDDLKQAVEENARNESCLSYQTVLRTPSKQCVSPENDQSVYLSPPNATFYKSPERSIKSPIFFKSPTSSLLQSPFRPVNNSHLHSTCNSNIFKSPNSLIQSSMCSPIDFRSAIETPTNWAENNDDNEKDAYLSCAPVKVDVSIQCQFPAVADELLAYFLKKLDSCLEWPRRFINWVRTIVNGLCERLRTNPSIKEPEKCDCFAKILEIEGKLKNLQAEMDEMRMQCNKPLIFIEEKKPVLNCGPTMPPPLPPPPPPPPPPPGLLLTQPIIFKPCVKKTEGPVSTPRPSVTVQDLQSVRLRKVSDRMVNDPVASIKSQGPMVTLEQLRSVKLRPRRKTPTQNQSPTRTPLTRDRMRKHHRSPGFRKERRPRIDRIPLSTILNMDEC